MALVCRPLQHDELILTVVSSHVRDLKVSGDSSCHPQPWLSLILSFSAINGSSPPYIGGIPWLWKPHIDIYRQYPMTMETPYRHISTLSYDYGNHQHEYNISYYHMIHQVYGNPHMSPFGGSSSREIAARSCPMWLASAPASAPRSGEPLRRELGWGLARGMYENYRERYGKIWERYMEIWERYGNIWRLNDG